MTVTQEVAAAAAAAAASYSEDAAVHLAARHRQQRPSLDDIHAAGGLAHHNIAVRANGPDPGLTQWDWQVIDLCGLDKSPCGAALSHSLLLYIMCYTPV